MKMTNIIVRVMFAAVLLISAAGVVIAHEHKPPHNGTLVECGEEFAHLELLSDAASGKLTGFVLDGEAENPVRIRQSSIRLKLTVDGKAILLNLKAVANPLTGEVIGDTSEFSAVSKNLKGVQRFSGTVVLIKVKGETFRNVDFKYPEGNEVLKPEGHGQEKSK
jgi:hypothetical protein